VAELPEVEIFTDGACKGNPGPGLPLQAPSVKISIRSIDSEMASGRLQ
jgi:hypothetical protein